VFQVFV